MLRINLCVAADSKQFSAFDFLVLYFYINKIKKKVLWSKWEMKTSTTRRRENAPDSVKVKRKGVCALLDFITAQAYS